MPRLSPRGERRLLQAVVAVLALVPVLAGGAGVVGGLAAIDRSAIVSLGGDSHTRYLSGLLLAIGLGFWSTLPRIEAEGMRFRALTGLVLIGGLARLYALALHGVPPLIMQAALAMELGATPLLALWRERLQRRLARGSDPSRSPGFRRRAARAKPVTWNGATRA